MLTGKLAHITLDNRIRKNIECDNCSISIIKEKISELINSIKPGSNLIIEGQAEISVTSNIKAEVYLNGIEQGTTPIIISASAGKQLDILIVSEGYSDYADEFTLSPNQRKKIKNSLKEKN